MLWRDSLEKKDFNKHLVTSMQKQKLENKYMEEAGEWILICYDIITILLKR